MIPGPTRIVEGPAGRALARQMTLASGNYVGAERWTDGKLVAPMLPELPEVTRCASCRAFYWIQRATCVGELGILTRYPERRFDVLLEHPGPQRIAALKAIRELTGLGLREAKRLLDQRPVRLLEDINAWEAQQSVARLERAGVSFQLHPRPGPPVEEPPPPADWEAAPEARRLTEEEYLEALEQGLGREELDERYLQIQAWWTSNDRFRSAEGAGSQGGSRSSAARESLLRLRALLREEEPSERLMQAEIERELACFDAAIRLLTYDFPEELRAASELIRDLAHQQESVVARILT